MSQNPGQWNPTGGPGYPQQGGGQEGSPQGGQPSGQQGYYPPQGSPPQGSGQQGSPQQYGQPQGSPQQYGGYPSQGGYATQPGSYTQQPGYGQGGFGQPTGYGAAGGYGPQPDQTQVQPPGWGQQGPGTYQPGGRPPTRKSPGLIIGIVVAAVVLLVAVGGIFIALSRSSDEPTSTITPAPPTSEPTPTQPTSGPSGQSSEPGQPSTPPTQPTGEAIDLGNGITLKPAAGWTVQDQEATVVSLTNRQGVFYGRQLKLDKTTNAAQFCDAFNRAALKSASNAKFGDAEPTDVGSSKLSAADCGATYTETSGDKSVQVFVSSLVSVRKSDGLIVVGTLLFVKNTDDQTKSDAGAMMSSMLTSQVS